MKAAIIQYPGSNCDQDALWTLRNLGHEAEYVWHSTDSLAGYDLVFVPGGFSYGDHLRCGAMAARSNIVEAIREFAAKGGPVIGVCNGFQVLCEAGLLPGALLLNAGQKFVCRDIYLQAENRTSIWTREADRPLRIPIAHGEGRYICDEETLARLEGEGKIAYCYVDEQGRRTAEANPNGSIGDIAGVLNDAENVIGMMPHPERAASPILGNTDGLVILSALSCVNAG